MLSSMACFDELPLVLLDSRHDEVVHSITGTVNNSPHEDVDSSGCKR